MRALLARQAERGRRISRGWRLWRVRSDGTQTEHGYSQQKQGKRLHKAPFILSAMYAFNDSPGDVDFGKTGQSKRDAHPAMRVAISRFVTRSENRLPSPFPIANVEGHSMRQR